MTSDLKAPGGAPWPVEIRRHRQDGSLSVEFDSGETARFSGAFLRAATPSASERGHGAAADTLLEGDFEGVAVLEVRPVGAYAIRLVFSDGHDTGLYTYESFYRLTVLTDAKSLSGAI